MKLKVLKIIDGTTVDGTGLRTSIYFAGCNHQCAGCHNPQSWNIDGGYEISIDDILQQVIENDLDVTFSGGDPLLQVEPLKKLAEKIKDAGKNIWCYTGYTFEEIIADPELKQILPHVDVIVDGPFIQSQRNISLHFRGSENQRVIDVKRSLDGQIATLY
ncbi:MAG: anaerobic ribonucleoside-triphosphate reductase activating protein [Muribaculaceae bacterium]|nr:anaerobic ribonucleoside-triphosphate reductase activating protein [Muribaculaceae bacterium]